MKFKRILGLAMAGTMLFSVPTFAAVTTIDQVDAQKIVHKDKTAGNYSVPYTAAQSGKEYILWVVKGVHEDATTAQFTQPNVLYINQETGGANGVSFNGFLPMSSVDSTVLISGEDMEDGPVVIGYIKGEGNTISGSIGLQERDSDKMDGVKIILADVSKPDVPIYEAITEADGTFEFNEPVADGTYTMTITKGGFLSYTKTEFTVDSDTVWSEEFQIELIAGDVDESGVVSALDYLEVIAHMNDSGSELIYDVDGSGVVSALDYLVIIANMGKSSVTE